MSTEKFIETVLPDEGYLCLFVAKNKSPKQKFFGSTEDLIQAAWEYDQKGFDAYFALGTVLERGSREASNIHALKSFFVDLDCGDDKAAGGKGYHSQQSAMQALRVFCQQYELPKPTLVNSGRGIHAYWILDSFIPKDEWVPLAARFKRLCNLHGLKIDPSVTGDCARVLRVPGTHNHKDEIPRTVTVLGDVAKTVPLEKITAVLDRHIDESDAPAPKETGSLTYKNDPFMSALSGNQTSRFRRILEKSIAGKGCQQILAAAKDQVNTPEPMWRAALSIAAHCIDSDKAIHRISKNHPQYDPAETERKAAMTKGPYLCQSFEDIDDEGCDGCPHRGKISSPIQLGKEVIAASEEDNIVFDKPEKIESALQEYVIPPYPFPYFRGKNGGVYVSMGADDEDDSDEQCVYHHDLYVVSRVNDPETGDGVIMRLHLPYDGVREFCVPLTAVTSREEFRKYLSKHGVAAARVEKLMDYSIKWINKLTYTAPANAARRQFGWIDDEFSGFAAGRALIFADRVEMNAPSQTTAPLFDVFEPKGSIGAWKQTMNFYNRPGFEEYQYVVGIGFGAALTAMTAVNGSVFHLFSKHTGIGKTAAMLASASIWGKPDRYILYERDTYASKMLRTEVLKNLPVYMDEMTNIDPKDASDMLYQIPSGFQRNRMAQDGNRERYRGEAWQTTVVSTGNTSLIERVAMYKALPKAEAQRVLECRARKIIFEDKNETDVFSNSLKEHYGHAGVPFMQYVLNNTDQVKGMLQKVQIALDRQAGLTAENRFWSAQAACVIVGIMIAKRIGLLNYDVKALSAWTVDMMVAAKAQDGMLVDDPLQIISDYIYDNYNSFLRLTSTDRNLDMDDVVDKLVVPTAQPKLNFVGRHETDLNKWYLIPKPLKEWCLKKQIGYHWLITELKNSKADAHLAKLRLGRGTKVNLPSVQALVLYGRGWMDDTDSTEEAPTLEYPEEGQ